MSRKHLLLVLGPNSWGRAVMALSIAEELRAAGEECVFIVSDSVGTLFEGTPFRVERVARHLGLLLQLVLDTTVQEERPDSLILCDFNSVHTTLVKHGCDPAALGRYGVPLIAMDTWDHQQSGFLIDRTDTEVLPVSRGIEELPLRLLPVPILRPDVRPGAFRCISLERLARRGERRAQAREALGLTEGERLVLFCSAEWQEVRHHSYATRQVVHAVVELIARCMERLAPGVRLMHVGPSPLEPWKRLGGRYRVSPPLPDSQLDEMLGAADLVLSANVAATTVARAIVAGTPTVVIQNSRELRADGPATAGHEVPAWLRDFFPLYPFALWPLKYRSYLEPVLAGNSYRDAFEWVELVEEKLLEETCQALLFDAGARAQHQYRQEEYLRQVKKLPSAAQVIEEYLR